MPREPQKQIIDEGSLHTYRTEIPNTVVRGLRGQGLSVHAKWLYVYLKSVAGDHRECFQGTRMLAQGSGLSLGTITTAKKELQDAKLITLISGKHGAHSTDRIRIKDIWAANMQEFALSVQQVNDEKHDGFLMEPEETDASVQQVNDDNAERSTGERSVQQVNRSVQQVNERRSQEEEPSKKGDPPVSTSVETSPVLTPETLIEWYNAETPPTHPKVHQLSPARIKKARQYLAMFPDPEFWHNAFRNISTSDFLLGRRPTPGHESFRGDFDWLLTTGKDGTENCVKASEGTRYQESYGEQAIRQAGKKGFRNMQVMESLLAKQGVTDETAG